METPVVFKADTIEDLRHTLGSDGLRELLHVYVTESMRDLEGLKAGTRAGSAQVVQFHAHRMKGASSSVGAEIVQYFAAAAEALARVGQVDLIRLLVPRISDAVDQAGAAAQRIR